MARLTMKEMRERISAYIGDASDDDALSLLEDVNDSLLDTLIESDGEDWKAKYEENDKNWRQRYRDRFDNVDSKDTSIQDEPEDFSPKDPDGTPMEDVKSIDDLFE